MKKVLLLLLVSLYLFSCGETKKTELEVIQEKVNEITTQTEPNDVPIILTEQQKFLSERGFRTDKEFTYAQFNEFKALISSDIFKNRDFCTVFHMTMKLDGKELKNYIKTISKKPYLEDMIIMYGVKACEAYSKEDMELRKKPSYQSSDNVCLMSKDFIKQDLNYPKTADFSMFDCSVENNTDGSYTILRKVGAKNSFGVESEFIYKVRLGFTGGVEVDIKNWELISMRSEEVK